ncbi:MAG: PAS domain S-box protein [Euryarchaeota archaeon]|nr:PAS domain S-box protein [Euryarchaeota archaeon]
MHNSVRNMPTLALKALLDISQIDLKHDLTQILEEIVTIVAQEMGAHSGTTMLVNEENGELEMIAAIGIPDDYSDKVYSEGVPITAGPSGVVLKTGEYYAVPNISAEPRCKPWMDLALELGLSSQLFMPMKRKGEVIGILNIRMAEPHEFTQTEIAFVSIAASHAAAVIENARLYSKVLQKKTELEREITERKCAEELKIAGERYRATFESTGTAMAILEEDTTISLANKEFVRLSGYSKEELEGKKSWTEFAAHEELERLRKYHYGRRKGEKAPTSYEFKAIDREGNLMDVYINVAVIPKTKESVISIMDITERKRVEEALQESEERFRSLFDNLSVGVAMIDREGQVLAANKTVSRFLGYSQEEVIGMPLSELIYPEDLEIDRDLFKPIIKGEEDHCLMDKRYVRKDGEIVWGRLHLSGVKDDEGHIKYMTAICEDITECKLVEKALLAKNSELASVFARCKHMKAALNRSEQKYKEIAEFLPDLIYKSILLDA